MRKWLVLVATLLACKSNEHSQGWSANGKANPFKVDAVATAKSTTMATSAAFAYTAVTSSAVSPPAPSVPSHDAIDPDLLRLAPAVVSALTEAKGALEDLMKVRAIVQSLEAGDTPSDSSNDWADVAAEYIAAAETIRTAPLPTVFDPAPYGASAAELRSCRTRQASLNKGKARVVGMREVAKRGNESLVSIVEAISACDQASATLVYLIEVHKKTRFRT